MHTAVVHMDLRGQCRQSLAYTTAGKAIPATKAGTALIVLRFLLISWLFKRQKEKRDIWKGKEFFSGPSVSSSRVHIKKKKKHHGTLPR